MSDIGERPGDLPAGASGAGPPAAPAPRGVDRRVRRRRRRRIVLSTLAVLVLALAGVIAWYEFEAHPLGGPGADVVVTIARGESIGSAIATLSHDGVIDSSLAFRLSDIVHGNPSVEPGAYLFRKNQSFSVIRGVLAAAPDVYSTQVRAGYTLAEVAERVSDLPLPPKGSFLKAASDGSVTSPYSPPGTHSLEGLVGTGWYQVLPGETSVQLLREMVERFDAQAASLHLTSVAAADEVTPAQLVIIASIVEKEGYIDANMGKVARVIYNRLDAGTPLQMDSTILYSLGQDGGTVTQADLQDNTPYNTYLHTGLTPTAICVPSKTALVSAAHPTPGGWLYFELVEKNGTEQFSDTYPEQLAAEALAASRGLP